VREKETKRVREILDILYHRVRQTQYILKVKSKHADPLLLLSYLLHTPSIQLIYLKTSD